MTKHLGTLGDAREVPDFPGYWATRDGRLFSTRRSSTPFEIKPVEAGNGYLRVMLYRGSVSTRVLRGLHRVVALTFIPNPNDLPIVRHLNGDPKDCRADNLAWGTTWDNEQDKRQHGTYWPRRGKLTRAQRDSLRERRSQGETYESLALAFGIGETTARSIAQGLSWPQDGAA